jgi:hypothetical protein
MATADLTEFADGTLPEGNTWLVLAWLEQWGTPGQSACGPRHGGNRLLLNALAVVHGLNSSAFRDRRIGQADGPANV